MYLTFLTCSISVCNPPPLCLDVPHLLDLPYFSLQPSTPVWMYLTFLTSSISACNPPPLCLDVPHLLDFLYFSLQPSTSVFGCTSPS
ncbi:hypothetical protein DPMN_186646 [Dreissena polymorpha]|uniref:Uncharacterized protein n=1 Tax=Dreissena polymorpha TaxID=45954 RepID=A0A9D4DMZ2_DREPO|nr:hypothetical protein DPMN_186646 [Dreissena polymorpha]